MVVIASAIGSAHAGTIASRVLGQPDLFHNSANTVDPQSIVMNNSHGGVAVDPAGHLYVSDQGNNRVLGWHSVSALVNDEPADLVIGQPDLFTGLAPSSTSASSLSGPRGVGVDSAGNVYVADTGDSRVLIFSDPFTTMSQTGQTAGDFHHETEHPSGLPPGNRALRLRAHLPHAIDDEGRIPAR